MNYATIPDFEALTAQQVFDMALAHVRTTRKQNTATPEALICSYHGAGCAARPFLRTEWVESLTPAIGYDANGWRSLHGSGLVPYTHMSLVEDIQACHDSWRRTNPEPFMAFFERAMKGKAIIYGLNYAPDSECEH